MTMGRWRRWRRWLAVVTVGLGGGLALMAAAVHGQDFPPPVQVAIDDLAARLGVPAATVSVVEVTATDWSDSSLGCPQPGLNYLTVITPGYIVVLEVNGVRYTYHTDEHVRAVICTLSQAPTPWTPPKGPRLPPTPPATPDASGGTSGGCLTGDAG